MSDEANPSLPSEAAEPVAPASERETPAADPLAEARAETAKYREQLLRTAADFDNFRKRTRKELEDERRRGKESALKDLLPVFDNLERALDAASESQDAKSITGGLRIVMKQFEGALGKVGLERVKAIGLPFDPTVHEAIQNVESKEHAAGVVVAEVQAGYRMGDYLMRAAMVVVSRGPGPESGGTPEAGGEGEGGAEPSADPAPEA